MASPTSEFGADVHIPLCDRQRCRDRITKLSKALEEKHLTCVVEYEISGTFERWYKKAFENCPYTIIHKCKHLWNKISRFESPFPDEDKVIAVDLSTKSNDENGRLPRSNSGLNDFFAKYQVSCVIDEKDFNAFVLKVVQHYANTVDSTRLPPDIISHQTQLQNQDSVQAIDTDEDKYVECEESFEAYPDIFGHTSHVSVRQSCLKCTEKEIAKFSDVKVHQSAEWRDTLTREKCTPHLKYVIHKVLPTLFESQKAIQLAYIASCRETDLQGEAMILLEMMLLSRNEDGMFTLNTRIQIESLLFEGLLDLYYSTWKEDKIVDVPIQRLSILYMMVLSDMIMSCKDGKEMKKCDVHLGTIAARGSKFEGVANGLHIFLGDLNKKTCSQMKKIADKFIRTDNAQHGANLCKENSTVQACVIVEIMKQVFEFLNAENLTLLHRYMEAKNAKAGNKNMPSACTTLLMRCLTIFLSYGLKKKTDQDLQLICQKALEIINLYLGWKITEDMYRFMQSLLFDNNPVIQKEIFKNKTDVEESMRCYHGNDQLPFLLNQLERLLCPLLLIKGNWKDKPDCVTEGKWELVQAKFYSHDVLLRVHSPVITSHREKNETGCHSSEDMYCNEMRVLQRLQHRNIIKMFAFQENRVPLFYIVEDHVQTNLQTALKHKRDNKDFFSRSSLLKFLVDTITALEYCHSKFYVHCNLTSESLFIMNKTSVKLCGFHLCLELVDGRGKIDKKHSRPVPIRWTAPETLRELEYTTASDIWMFGHLMYEVLTHGELPYPDIDDVSKKIILGQISLPEKRCFKREHYNLISECTDLEPGSRPSLMEVKEQLDHLFVQLEKTAESQIEAYSFDSNHVSSTKNKKDIQDTPDVSSSKFFEDQDPFDQLPNIVISDTMMRITAENKYIFREKMVHKVTQDMAIKVEDGKLSDVLSGVSIFQNRDEVHHIDCHIPRSCHGNLLELPFERALGTSLKPYLECLLQVTSVLKKLHERSWILGDMCASHLYVEQIFQGLKIHVVSLAYLLPCEGKDARSSPPGDTHVCARAAPEVIKYGIFSPESDVYCFGYLMWEVLTAFDHQHQNVEDFMKCMESTHGTPDEEYKQKENGMWEESHKKPSCCSDSLFELIKSCVVSASVRRITLNELIAKLRRIYEDLTDESVPQHSRETKA